MTEETILKYGEMRLESLLDEDENLPDSADDEAHNIDTDNKVDKNDQIRQALRDLARYLKYVREEANDNNLTLKDIYETENLPYMSKAAQRYSRKYKSPHALDMLKRHLGKCS